MFRYLGFLLVLLCQSCGCWLSAQLNNATLHGTVADPTGAVIPGASVSIITVGGRAVTTLATDELGSYQSHSLNPGIYIVIVTAPGFASSSSKAVTLVLGQAIQYNVVLQIQVDQQQVQVDAGALTVGTDPDNNANAIDLKGKDLDALSDDPDELQNELQALAGPAAGSNGGQIYIDGFTGGQIPPKSSIREIRINQNPFSAEFDRLGYGRIEIFTKPGTDKLHGQIESRGNESVLNSQNPILNANLKPGEPEIQQPGYYSYNLNGSVGGPINKAGSYFLSVFARNNQNEAIVDATNPENTTETLNEAISNPSTRIDISPRIDLQLGNANTLTIRDDFYRSVQSNSGLSALTLPTQAYNTNSLENAIQVSDSVVLNKNLVDDIRFQYRRIRNQQLPVSDLPTVSVEGAFTTGGSNAGTVEDHQDDYELQDYFVAAEGRHSLNFGTRLRAYRDTNYTSAGSNSSYTFDTIADYLAGTPQQYTVTVINQYDARAILFDAALFYQDDWKVKLNFTFSYGLRWETQNRIHDKDDWAPRLSVAYALGGNNQQKPKTVLRAGYGWFYQRFTVPTSFSSTQGAPYIIQTIHNNFVPLGSSEIPNQQGFTVDNPDFYNPAQPVTSLSGSTGAVAPTGYSVDPHFHAANDMQSALGIDQQFSRRMTGNLTYLYSRGVHMYLTNNVSAVGNFPVNNIVAGTYPASPVAEPPENNMQYQSVGVYRQSEVIGSFTARYPRFSISSFYTYTSANADTSGVTYTPSIAVDPEFDYSRASFDIHDRFVLLGNITAPWQVSFAPFVSANSGTPYNITTGSDLTGNNQFNARPTFATSCGQPGAVSTLYGCLDPDSLSSPSGAGEKIVPHNLGTGPRNVSLNLRVSKTIGFGPRTGGTGGSGFVGGGQGRGQGGGIGGGLGLQGLSGGQGGPVRRDSSAPHRYNLTLTVYGQDVLNHENLAAPNGTLSSPLFGKSQSLAGGFFGASTAGNRSIFFETDFHF
jgi:hypothetical protein